MHKLFNISSIYALNYPILSKDFLALMHSLQIPSHKSHQSDKKMLNLKIIADTHKEINDVLPII